MHRFLIAISFAIICSLVLAQEDVTLDPFKSNFGFSGVHPAGWTEAGPMTYVRASSATDPTTLIQQAAPQSAEQLGELLVQQLALVQLPDPTETIETETLTWTIYDVSEVESPTGMLSASIGLAQGKQGYVVVLMAVPDEFEELRESVFIPVVNALTPDSDASLQVTSEVQDPAVEVAEPAEAAAAGEIYESPDGTFSVPVPSNWTVTEEEGYLVLSDPENLIRVYALSVANDDPTQTVDESIRNILPDFELSLEEADVLEPPSSPGVDRTIVVTYDGGEEAETIYQGVAQLVDGTAYLLIFEADLAASARRQSQINVIASGFTINAVEEVDLVGTEPLAVDAEIIAELETFINDALETSEVPGAAVAIVQDGEVIYSNGFGVLEAGGSDPVTPETLMMIGSTTKTFTTLYLAQLVDEGVIEWDTPVVQVLPSFALADSDMTQTITVRNLVCACSGVPRRDLELVFNADELSAQDIVESLAGYEVFTAFGQAFQYSNQLVAMGGYAGALATGSNLSNLYEGYTSEIQERILDPIGMPNTTFDFAEVTSDAATPHGINLDFEYYPLDLHVEEFVMPIAPAGALWSNVIDMSRYLITQMQVGVSPDGIRIVSEENLRETWQPQVEVSAQMSYGLGWFVDEYKGLQLLHHGGNTFGFTSDLAFLPEASIGIVVLTNGRASNIVNEAVRTRLFELVFEQEADSIRNFEFAIEQGKQSAEEADFSAELDLAIFEPFIGTYSNPGLGTVEIRVEDDTVIVDAGEFESELRASLDEEGEVESYLLYNAPLTGLEMEFEVGDDKTRQLVIDIVTDQYVFTATE
jgi:CubicO group peptidase (beta-lactamase class C family)